VNYKLVKGSWFATFDVMPDIAGGDVHVYKNMGQLTTTKTYTKEIARQVWKDMIADGWRPDNS